MKHALFVMVLIGLLVTACGTAALPAATGIAPESEGSAPESTATVSEPSPPATATIAAATETATATSVPTAISPSATPPPTDTATPEPTATDLPPTETVPSPTEAAPATRVAISIEDFRFAPGTVTVSAGTTVVWTHIGEIRHTVTAEDGSFDSPTLASGDTFEVTFTTPGTYAYYCRFHGGPGHSGMAGVVTVTD